MDNFEALYYPSFEPPINWLRGFLLFFDKIKSIVPSDVDFQPSRGVAELIDIIPGGFDTISPHEHDINIDDFNLGRMRKALELIYSNNNREKGKHTIEIIMDGSEMRIKGYAFLHDKKISDEIRTILNEYNLISNDLGPIFSSCGGLEGFSLVDESASNLILSYIAERVSRRYGIHSITDSEMGFIVNNLDALGTTYLSDPENLLALSIISSQVPSEVAKCDVKQYKDIRNAYSDVRQTFKMVIMEISNLHKLNRIEDSQHLLQRINEITKEFNEEFDRFKASRIGRNIKRWLPIVLTNLPVLLGSYFANPKISKIICSGGAIKIGYDIIKEIRQGQPDKTNLFRMMGSMQERFINPVKVEELMLF